LEVNGKILYAAMGMSQTCQDSNLAITPFNLEVAHVELSYVMKGVYLSQ
jgi:hypothetical protein